MGGAEILALLWKYREYFLYAIIAGVMYWAFVHNPKVIKQLEEEKRAVTSQRDSAYAAIDLGLNITKKHIEREKEYEENLRKIRTGKKPAHDGIFVGGGMLPAVFESYSAGGNTTP